QRPHRVRNGLGICLLSEQCCVRTGTRHACATRRGVGGPGPSAAQCGTPRLLIHFQSAPKQRPATLVVAGFFSFRDSLSRPLTISSSTSSLQILALIDEVC